MKKKANLVITLTREEGRLPLFGRIQSSLVFALSEIIKITFISNEKKTLTVHTSLLNNTKYSYEA